MGGCHVFEQTDQSTYQCNLRPSWDSLAFFWHTNWRRVTRIHETWRDTGSWWEGEAEKAFYLLQTGDGGTYELYFDLREKSWYLYKIID